MTNIITKDECALQMQLLEKPRKHIDGLFNITLTGKCSDPTCT